MLLSLSGRWLGEGFEMSWFQLIVQMRIEIDTGGTFTDVIVVDQDGAISGAFHTKRSLSIVFLSGLRPSS
jgi:hypothetical protein